MRPSLLLLTALVLAALSSNACAQRQVTDEQKQAMQERWRAADSNGDGFIDRAEAEASLPWIAKRFDQLDANRDGKLSQDELRAAAAGFAARRRR